MPIQSLSDVDESTLREIFSVFYNEKDVTAEILGDYSPLSNSGTNDNYNSEVKKLSVNVTRPGEAPTTVNIVFKIPVASLFLRRMQKMSRPLLKEVLWYTKAAPQLAKTFPEINDITPQCFYGYSNYIHHGFEPTGCEKNCFLLCWAPLRKLETGILLLENITQRTIGPNFKTIDKTKVLTLPYARLAMRALAQYHGAWWRFMNDPSMKATKGELFTQNDLTNAFVEKTPVFLVRGMVDQTYKSLTQLMKNKGYSDGLIRRVKAYSKTRAMEQMAKLFADSDRDQSEMKTICHGDFWTNNMMFSHNEQTGNPTDVKLIDFQMLAKAHPSRDIFYLLYVNSDKAFRDTHLDECLRLYFEEFSKYTNSIKEFTFDQFRKECQERREIGLTWGMLVMTNVLSPNQRELSTMRQFREMGAKRHEDIASPDKDGDHPMIRELRRRAIEMVDEFEALGAF